MISGRLGVRIGFEEFEPGPGDSISFDAGSPHRLWTIGAKPAVAIWVVVNRHGDRRTRQAKQVVIASFRDDSFILLILLLVCDRSGRISSGGVERPAKPV